MRWVNWVWVAVLPGCLSEVPPIPPGEATATPIEITALNSPGAVSGSIVSLENVVVSAFDTYDETGEGRVGTAYVQEPEGGARSGIQLFAAAVAPAGSVLVPGDVVDVRGEFVLFEGPPGSSPFENPLPQITFGNVVQKVGEWAAPEPVTVPVAELLANGIDYVGSLVRVEGLTAQTGYERDPPRFETEEGLVVASALFVEPSVLPGTRFTSITGVFTYFYDFQILPRHAADLVVEPGSPLAERSDATCADGADNDGNGATDCDEPSCAGLGGCP
ncbi:MAG: hypothetical protein IT379_01990 [Deltaproteobacteria bacterium]|nr:hypothetical protein [Deltaproteobacteria bacterium]